MCLLIFLLYFLQPDVFEEKVMAVDNAPPLVVIGMEGLWGTFLTLILVYPAAYMIPGNFTSIPSPNSPNSHPFAFHILHILVNCFYFCPFVFSFSTFVSSCSLFLLIPSFYTAIFLQLVGSIRFRLLLPDSSPNQLFFLPFNPLFLQYWPISLLFNPLSLQHWLTGSDNGSFESFSDSLLMIQSSPQLQNLVLGFVFTVTLYNCKFTVKLIKFHTIL